MAHWRRQGDLGEMSAMEGFTSKGAYVYMPMGHSPDVDFVIDVDGDLQRVQVKTTTVFRFNRWQVTVATRGGNQSWNGEVKRLDASRCDHLFVVVGDGRRWCIPSPEIGGGCGLVLGGPKYEAFEIERGRPLPARDESPSRSTMPARARGDVRVVKGAAL